MADQNSLDRKAGGGGRSGAECSRLHWEHASMVWQPHTPPSSRVCHLRNMLPWEPDFGHTDRLWKTVSELQQSVREGLAVREGLRAFFWQSFWPPSLWAATLASVSGVHAVSYCSLSDKNIAAVFGRLTCISTAWTKPWWITDLPLNGVSLSGAGGREPTLFLFMPIKQFQGTFCFRFLKSEREYGTVLINSISMRQYSLTYASVFYK